MQRIKMTIQYDGTAYCGWQRQPDPTPTVQRTIERAIMEVLSQNVSVRGSSRTDTGVHALGQVALAEINTHLDPDRVRKAINSRLPEDILIRHAEIVGPEFNLHRAIRKCYRYTVWADRDRPVFSRPYVYHFYRKLDVEAMTTAAKEFLGEHDFAAFRGHADERQSTVRRIFDCSLTKRDKMLIFNIEGNGFLYNMIRIMIGTMLEVGVGHYGPEKIRQIITSRDRAMAGPTAMPQGLCLQWIKFAESDADANIVDVEGEE